ncbi:relaxase/mobilization nuclease domain-containing protein [Paraflavitalea speifideaquila]|uniref:relaxase/mobilization nuclease domain-containing protein n=1 Tax=Paraflavitalea speifideaquila TaxID=3076558 RepID=UPI0028ECF74F|nr:relaxase/mobilization nuclease domain-containing protein [Paraflavitalea speifideiaquila]
MIGRSKVGKGFYGCISYNLNDKRELSEEEKERMMKEDGLQHKDRAEVLYYNRCYGNAAQLSKECMRVAKQNDRVENPVFHFSLRLAPGDSLSKEQWVDIAQKLAREFNFQDNQYIVILHNNTLNNIYILLPTGLALTARLPATETTSVERPSSAGGWNRNTA